jgi:hypothetical protein
MDSPMIFRSVPGIDIGTSEWPRAAKKYDRYDDVSLKR